MPRKTEFERKIEELFGRSGDERPVLEGVVISPSPRRYGVRFPVRPRKKQLDWFGWGLLIAVWAVLLAFAVAFGVLAAIWVDALIKAG